MPRPPIPAHSFFMQAVFQGEIDYDLLEGGGPGWEVGTLFNRRDQQFYANVAPPIYVGTNTLHRRMATQNGASSATQFI